MEPDGLVGARLAGARREAGLSQRALAATLGVTPRTVQNYESGKIVPYRHLASLSALLGRTASWLLTGTGSPDGRDVVASSRRQRAMLTRNLDRQITLRRELVALGARQHALLAEAARPARTPKDS
jgi:HTH-type transcriptional regulator, cell division transcriptional repressor